MLFIVWREALLTGGVRGRTDFLVTASVDGHLKLWKKQANGIEFAKHFRAHLAPITGISASADGQLVASISDDGTAKVFDVVNCGASYKILHVYASLNDAQI